MADPTFDHFASSYETALQAGLSLSGESSDYFADLRVRCLRQRLEKLKTPIHRLLDFGCGVGATTKFFLDQFQLEEMVGIDPSSASIEIAKKNEADRNSDEHCQVKYQNLAEFLPDEQFDMVYCNGVFHHIDLLDRYNAMMMIYQSLRPGGIFAFWENNPYSLPARYVMSRISFDADAVMVWPLTARQMMRNVGFRVLLTDYRFVFPRLIRWMRWSENLICKLPLGAQYLVLCTK